MARSTWGVEYGLTDELHEKIMAYGGNAENAINEILWNQGGDMITESIMGLLPVSGRSWRGKKPAAKSAKPFSKKKETLAVIVQSKREYNYLYFPDDGSNTYRHAGQQHFMERGAEAASDDILRLCVERLVNDFEGG